MKITLDIPDELWTKLIQDETQSETALLEAIAVDGYHNGRLTYGEAAKLAGVGWRLDFDGVLKRHDGRLEYTVEDFESDMETMEKFFGRHSKVA